MAKKSSNVSLIETLKKNAAGILALAALLTAVGGILVPIVVKLIERQPVPAPDVVPPSITATTDSISVAFPPADATSPDGCLDTLNPQVIPIFEVPLDIPQTFDFTPPISTTFGLKFLAAGAFVGGMVLSYQPADQTFYVWSNINGSCHEVEICPGAHPACLPSGKSFGLTYQAQNFLLHLELETAGERLSVAFEQP